MAAGDKAPLTAPAVVWAQRTDKVYLTINLEDCKDPVIELSESQLHFKGKGGPNQEEHEVTMEFYGELDTTKSKYVVQSRNIPMVLVRKEEGPYWPHLLKVKGKVHWLKTDFEKWKDEDESEDEEPGMGGMGGMGMPGMGGMGMPGMGGMGGMGMPGMGGPGGMDLSQMMSQMGGGFDGGDIPADGDAGDEEPDSDDEELPDLE